MSKFKRTRAPYSTANELVEEYVLELRPGHTITRVDRTSRLGAGRKGRAAEVTVVRELTCTCGAHLGFGGLTIREDLANLRHFDSEDERIAYEAEQEQKKQRILKSLAISEQQKQANAKSVGLGW